MRVIAGKHRSRKLLMVNDDATRETKDRVKESIFNMIGPYHKMDDVLDLFAGSGALGIEACSRGANNVVFVDQAKKATDVINQNLKDLSMNGCSEVFNLDAFRYLKMTEKHFDLIFLDPPYNHVSLDDCLSLIAQKNILKQGGLIVVLTDQHTTLGDIESFERTKQKRITRTNVIFLKG